MKAAANDDEVHSILLDIDSPGGEATGMFALASLIREVRAVKPVVALIDDMAASAAYGIASAANEIVISPTSITGSIGVVMLHLDRSQELQTKGIRPTLIHAGAHKVDGNSFGPLSDDVSAALTRDVMTFYDRFLETVAAGRGPRLSADAARATEARTFIGVEAISLGLADRIGTLDQVVADLSTQRRPSGGPRNRQRTKMENETITPAAHAAAVTTARAEGAAGERERIRSILTCEEAKGREAQAQTLALDMNLSAEDARKVLATSPKASAGPSIEEQHAAAQEIGGNAKPNGAQSGAAIDAAWNRALASINGTK
jgi:signal peptide peptidase SppA